MSYFRQAAPDPEKASRDGVTNYIPSRRQIDLSHPCEEDCAHVAKWEIEADGRRLHACDTHRRELTLTARTYTEKRI